MTTTAVRTHPDTGTLRHPVPVAPRLRRPGMRDPRLLGGLVLVALAVLLGARVVSTAAATVPVVVATRTLVPGDAAVPGLEVRQVRLDASVQDGYLVLDAGRSLEDVVDPEAVVLHPVGAGDLVPRSALGDRGAVDVRPVAVTPGTPLASDVAPGGLVDLWFVPEPDGADVADPPRLLASGLVVAEVEHDTAAFAVGAGATVQLLVPTSALPDVLAATAGEGEVAVVAVPGSAP